MSTATKQLTVEEYEKIPNPPGGRYELHHGELVFVPFPKSGHKTIQWRLEDLLRPFAKGRGEVRTEFPFRAQSEYEMRGADVAFVSKDRFDNIDPDGWLIGAPELVIEVMSRSNTFHEMEDKASLCLASGSVQFWAVNPLTKAVTVFHRGMVTQRYTRGQAIPLGEIFGKGQLAVDDIFSPTAE